MCSFTVLGGPWGVRKPISIWCDHHLPSSSHRVDQVVVCGLWDVGPLIFNGLYEVAGYWQELEHAVVYADPEHPKHAQWVTCPVSMLAMQELGCFQLPGIVYRSCNMGPCIIMLQHEVMVVDELHNNGPQDLVIVSLCFQNAINKMHLCSLSITPLHHGPLDPQR